jgi:hypothetical protein
MVAFPVEGPSPPNDVSRNERPVTDGRFDPMGGDRFMACGMVRSSALSAKPSAKAPAQEPCPRVTRRRWQRRKGLVGGVERSGGAISRELGNNRLRPLAHG